MKDLNEWQDLAGRLPPICCSLMQRLAADFEADAVLRIAHGFLQSGVDTFGAIRLLYAEPLPMQAQIMIRVLIEVRVNCEVYLRNVAEDPREAARRVIDAMMLEKMKQQRQSNFRGLERVDGAPTREEWEAREGELIKRYGTDTANAMRRHGFSGISIESRARKVGLSDLYNVVYRNFSRNVHGIDYAEYLRRQDLRTTSKVPGYEDVRDHVGMSSAMACLWDMAFLINKYFEYGLDEMLVDTWDAFTSFRHWVPMAESLGNHIKQRRSRSSATAPRRWPP